jgi:hypothetical protein
MNLSFGPSLKITSSILPISATSSLSTSDVLGSEIPSNFNVYFCNGYIGISNMRKEGSILDG